MVDPIYHTTDSQSGAITTETHDIGPINGLPNNEAAEPPIKYIEIPNGGTTGPRVSEFPSKNAGIEYGGDADVVNPMDTD